MFCVYNQLPKAPETGKSIHNIKYILPRKMMVMDHVRFYAFADRTIQHLTYTLDAVEMCRVFLHKRFAVCLPFYHCLVLLQLSFGSHSSLANVSLTESFKVCAGIK
jgi:hypothetical protein